MSRLIETSKKENIKMMEIPNTKAFADLEE